MADQLEQGVGKAPNGVHYPIWAWYQWEGERKRLDMRTHRRRGVKGIPIVLLTLAIPDHLVLLSDFDMWHCVLNHGEVNFSGDIEKIYTERGIRESWNDIGWTSEGFVLTLLPDNLNHHERSKYHLKMVWSDVLCYQVTQESYRPDVWIDAPEKAWAFCVTQSSKYLQGFKRDNPLVPENVYHFLVIGTNFVIDVLSGEYPTIKFIDQGFEI